MLAAAPVLHNIYALHLSLLGHLSAVCRAHGGSADVKVHPAAEAISMSTKSTQHLWSNEGLCMTRVHQSVTKFKSCMLSTL